VSLFFPKAAGRYNRKKISMVKYFRSTLMPQQHYNLPATAAHRRWTGPACALMLACLAGQPMSAWAQGFCDRIAVAHGHQVIPVETGLAAIADRPIRQQAEPRLSDYTPADVMKGSAAESTNPLLATGDRFYALHGGVRSADEVHVAAPPSLAYQWTAESNTYLPEGPSFGDDGVYFTPLFTFPSSELDYTLGSISPESGLRRWVVGPGQYGQGGGPLVLPGLSGGKIVYGGGAEAVFAIRESGELLWCTETGLPTGDPVADLAGSTASHLYGINYQPETDTLVAIYGTGVLVGFDRGSGTRLGTFVLPGAPALDSSDIDVPDLIMSSTENAIREQFVPPGYALPEDLSLSQTLIAALLGGGGKVNNFFAADPDSQALWVAATDLDGADGTLDGISEFGALYRVDTQRQGDELTMSIHCSIPFNGGTASTPAIAPGGELVYTTDSFGKVLSFDADCQERWAVDVGEQVLGSVAVSSTDGNIYAASGRSVFRIQDLDSHGQLLWEADVSAAFDQSVLLDAIEALDNLLHGIGISLPITLRANNLDIATITENAILMQASIGIHLDPDNILAQGPLAMAVVALDKVDGAVLNASPAREETVSVMAASQQGEVYLAHSPIRRPFIRGLALQVALQDSNLVIDALAPPLIGGVSRYALTHNFDLAARDNACFAERRLRVWNASGLGPSSMANAPEGRLLPRMLDQALAQLYSAYQTDEVSLLEYAISTGELQQAKSLLERGSLLSAEDKIAPVCARLR
jgi:hypothetical protein